jgi:stage V sporulation protein S
MAGVVRQSGAVEVQVVGAGALNQAIKAVAIARGYVAPSGIDLLCVPTFADIEIEGQSRTAIRLLVECRGAAPNPVTAPKSTPQNGRQDDEVEPVIVLGEERH